MGGIEMAVFKIESKGNIIESVDRWFEYAGPTRGSDHWKDGKSAKELAKFIIEDDGGNKILEYLEISFDGLVNCYPEYTTRLPAKGGNRNHDLLLVAEDNSFLIGVEAKSDESFDRYYKDLKPFSENRKRRIEELSSLVFNDKDFDVSNLRNQLLTGTGGTLIEAKNRDIKKIYFLALVLNKKDFDYDDRQIKRNEEDFILFDKLQDSISMNYMKIEVE